MPSDQSLRASLHVTALGIAEQHSEFAANGPYKLQNKSDHYSPAEMTPPATPNGSQENLASEPQPPIVFHNFLRAFYPFHPSFVMTDASVTIPLNEGDVVLVHSIHTNGWADGTLISSGDRGWLPTNYCEPYEPEDIQSLLKALLNFWDLLRSTAVDDSDLFRNQEFMKGIIAGVRHLLERTNCLNRESAIIQRNEPLRKCRKSLLAELSALVKSAKRLQEVQRNATSPDIDINDVVDEMILKAFKIVNKSIKFLDVLDEDRRARAPASVTVMATVVEESYVPPTPPSERTHFSEQRNEVVGAAESRAGTDDTTASIATSDQGDSVNNSHGPWNKRISSLNNSGASNPRPLSQDSPSQNNHRSSATMSHRVSLAGPSPLSRPGHLVSERLNSNHDKFLSHLGAFIGRLHWQSPSRTELSVAIKQSAVSGGQLLAIVDGICANSVITPVTLHVARGAVFDQIQSLVISARNTLAHAAAEGSDMIMPADGNILLANATACVKTAGECVAKAKATIERIGDFEFEFEGDVVAIDLSVLDVISLERSRSPSAVGPSEGINVADSWQPVVYGGSSRRPSAVSVADSTQSTEFSGSSRRPSENTSMAELMLLTADSGGSSRRPSLTTTTNTTADFHYVSSTPVQVQQSAALHSASQLSSNGGKSSDIVSSTTSSRPNLPPLPRLTTSLPPSDFPRAAANSNSSARDVEAHSARFDSLIASSAGSSATYLSRDSETSIVSQTSTRATTPDHTAAPRNKPSISDMSTTESSTTNGDEADDVESRLLEKTFAHELMFNKEGQVTGGSLPALVERLTMHESTPDLAFTSAFFLTFRLFCTPVKLTRALIDRFDYVAESPHMATPVRLRVYNTFKGWLESHWRDQTDRDALKLIMPFAEVKLAAVLPTAGRRLLELAMRVSGQGSLLPKLVSSIGKTNTAIGLYVPSETPLPSPSISKHQQSLLNSFKNGSSSPTILDFDPLELARQLTIRQMGIFCAILPEELLGSQWMKRGGVDAPNVKAMSSLSTDLSNLVAETILQYPEVKRRATVIKHWIKIAHHCLSLHNYDGLMAIICSLNSSIISRLRKTWDVISEKRKEQLRILQKIVEPSQNNKVLRTKLHDHVPPCLPFLGMYLTDLTFNDIGNPATKQMSLGSSAVEDGSGGLTVVNFDKHTRTAKIIGELQRFQIPYRLVELPDMQDWMTGQINRVRETDQGNVQVSYYRKSLLLEPRESRKEREPPTPVSAGTGNARGDLFGWMSRDRGGHPAAPTQV